MRLFPSAKTDSPTTYAGASGAEELLPNRNNAILLCSKYGD
jgi:hypothetical protein